MDPRGKVALVTGAASGIGRASALLLASHGAVVAVADLDAAAGEETVAAILARGGTAVFLRLDVSDPAALADTLTAIVDAYGALDVLHNNAGIVTGFPDFPDCAPERIATVVAVNLTGTLVATRLAAEAMRPTGGGAIVNMSSTLALATRHRDPVYAATKAAVLKFTELCTPLAETHGVRVNCILPGGVDTPIIGKTGSDGEPAEWMRDRLGEIDLIAPETIAATVLELVEDDARAGEAIEVRDASSRVSVRPRAFSALRPDRRLSRRRRLG